MTTTESNSKLVYIDLGEMESMNDALEYYRAAFCSAPGGNIYGQDGILNYLKSTKEQEFLWVHLWFGKNHQRIKVGDTVRLQSPNDDPEFTEGEVLAVATYTALVLSENGAEWHVWPLVHRMDKLHTEPAFDTSHAVPVQRHMGYDPDPGHAAEYDEIVASRSRLTVVST